MIQKKIIEVNNMANKTIGVVETKGLLDAFLASDAMIKGANVELTARYLLGGGVVTLVISGAPATVKSAIDIAEKDFAKKNIRTAIIPNMSGRVAEIMLSAGESQENRPLSRGGILKKRDRESSLTPRAAPGRGGSVPSIFDTNLGADDHLESSYKKRRATVESEKDVKKRQALIIQYLVANRHNKVSISNMEKVIPNASKVTLRRDLHELIDQGKIEKVGRGRATHYKIR